MENFNMKTYLRFNIKGGTFERQEYLMDYIEDVDREFDKMPSDVRKEILGDINNLMQGEYEGCYTEKQWSHMLSVNN